MISLLLQMNKLRFKGEKGLIQSSGKKELKSKFELRSILIFIFNISNCQMLINKMKYVLDGIVHSNYFMNSLLMLYMLFRYSGNE